MNKEDMVVVSVAEPYTSAQSAMISRSMYNPGDFLLLINNK